jgi:membrane protease YdiL (CAAX protease family)
MERSKQCNAIEARYSEFVRQSAPTWVWLSIFLLPWVIAVGLGFFDAKPPFEHRAFSIYESVVIPAAVLVLVLRGRTTLRTVVFGRLRPFIMVIAGIATGVISVLFSFALVAPDLAHFRFDSSSLTWDAAIPKNLVLAPLQETILFQGVIQTALQRYGATLAVCLTTALFAAAHIGTNGIQAFDAASALLLIRMLLSLCVFAVVRQWTKSLGAVVVGHALSNVVEIAFFAAPL